MTTPAYPTITEELLAELEGSALLATKGSWCTDGNTWVCANDSDQLNNGFVLAICEGTDERKNADYMAKANPATILALLQHVRELKADKDRLDSGMIITRERDDFGHEYKCHRRGLDLRAMIDEAIEEARSK